jgi:hypothetical protein
MYQHMSDALLLWSAFMFEISSLFLSAGNASEVAEIIVVKTEKKLL